MPEFTSRRRVPTPPPDPNQQYDIAIIGGGITGCGAARDAALRGLKVILFERGDIASGTSSRSSRLIHGGLRYLEHYRFGLVHESVAQRWELMRVAPHLVRPLEFYFPVYKGEKPALWMMNLGTWLYSLLSAFRTPGPRTSANAAATIRAIPGLRPDGLLGAAAYFDCSTNDARLTLETAREAAELGATILPYSIVKACRDDDKGLALTIDDLLTGGDFAIRAKTAIVAAGPWTDPILELACPGTVKWLRPTKGVHLVFRSDRLPIAASVVMKSIQDDGRVTFAIPWGTHTYVGTTDTDHPDPEAAPCVTAADVRYMLDITNHYFPHAHLESADVCSVWAGLRPLVAPHDEVDPEEPVDPSDVSREEKYETYRERYVAVAGGKLTTYRVMARHVVDRCARLLSRHWGMNVTRSTIKNRPLLGGVGIRDIDAFASRLADEHPDMPADWVRRVGHRYGARAPEVLSLAAADPALLAPLPGYERVKLAELHHAIINEHACTIEDFLVRRTYTYFKADDQGYAAAGDVADALASLNVVTREEADLQLARYRAHLSDWKNCLQS